MKYFQKIKNFLSFDIRDIFYLSGIGMLGYGLYLWKGLWLTFIGCGLLLMVTGYLMKDK